MPKTYSIHGVVLKTNYLNLDANLQLRERARILRKTGNLPEVLFLMQVNKAQFHGLDFDRQKIAGNYIVDFYVKALGLVVEIDGDSHEGNDVKDEQREKWLENQGCKVIRFPAYMVVDAMPHVLINLEQFILENYR